MRWMRVLLCVAACLSACALPGSSQGPTASQVLRTRMAAFAAARSVTMIGHVSYGDVTYPVSLQVNDQGGASGTVELNHILVSALLAGGRTFLKNAGYYKGLNLASGGQWVLEREGPVVDLLAKLADRKGLAAALLAAAGSDVRQGPRGDAGGIKTVRLETLDFSATVPAAGGPPTRIVTQVDSRLSDDLSDVRLDFSDYGLAASFAAPDTFLDRSQPDTWPAAFSAVIGIDSPFNWDGCDRSGCTLSANLKNSGGKVGSATATFYVSRGGSILGTCDVAIPATSYNATVRVGCRVDYDNSSQTSGNVQVHNPQ
ncbi:MAG TPA: hypothetical protein VE953_24680 [Terriglobales bacterium]|nr:hypothetical protein [Terriglobales bacterium]